MAGGALRLEERISHVEGQVNELSLRLSGVEAAIRHLEQRTDARFDAVDRRFEVLDAKMSRQFTWLVGIQITTLIAIVAALLSRG
ncbi:MAG: hypothetical protein A3I61_04250 [Acidobacteria bacterium RIFCSPLOWO2_02_FULL_68_18]|nr:MAG: hypothetical protein A3I61_04250 [Acidobacteria bacterium RIFCSPLOWO2_02_FULL_68_18]OFW52069.1 MAG: hypothetical protein A3G77_02895 [Acidobacteria bacterium RIFCSPLOWO2_12_FULL_68_19]